MRVAIIGAGIVGITTAYELALQGHQVTVLERGNSVATEASFAHAGLIAPGAIAPWAACGAAWRMGGINALQQLPWLWRNWRASRPLHHAANRDAMQALAVLSRDRLLALTRTLALEYAQMPGHLVLLRSARDLKAAQPAIKLMQAAGVVHDVIDATRSQALEPNLHMATPLHAAIHLPQDGVGNCRQFAHLLKAQAQRLGARFHFDTTVRGITPGALPAVETADGQQSAFDAVVICAGAQASPLLRSIGVKLPLAAVHGYSVTAPLRHLDGYPAPGPRTAVMDGHHQIAITRLGQRIRVAGIAEIGGDPASVALAPLRTLYRVLDDWFPGAAMPGQAQHWKGTRAMLPDGPPVLGGSGAPGVWLNLGHGNHGWTLACGAARVLAERIAGREAPLDMARFTAARLR